MSDMPESFTVPDRIVQKGLSKSLKNPIGEAARKLGVDPRTPGGRKRIFESMNGSQSESPKVPRLKTQADVNKAIEGLSEHALSPEEKGSVKVTKKTTEKAAKIVSKSSSKDALRAVEKAVKKGNLKGKALQIAKTTLRNGAKKYYRVMPEIFEEAGPKALGFARTAGKIIKFGLKFSGLLTLFFLASDIAEAGTFTIPQAEWYRYLENAYKKQNVPENERLTNKEFWKLNEKEQIILLNKYGIGVGVKPEEIK